MDWSTLPGRFAAWYAVRPLGTQIILALLVTVLTVELICRRFAPNSAFYRAWTRGVEAVGSVWTAVILSIIYVVSVGPVGLVLRLVGKDPLERSRAAGSTFWRQHEPNPLGPRASARHQF